MLGSALHSNHSTQCVYFPCARWVERIAPQVHQFYWDPLSLHSVELELPTALRLKFEQLWRVAFQSLLHGSIVEFLPPIAPLSLLLKELLKALQVKNYCSRVLVLGFLFGLLVPQFRALVQGSLFAGFDRWINSLHSPLEHRVLLIDNLPVLVKGFGAASGYQWVAHPIVVARLV